ncbi:nicotinamide-nucleotide amidohydrolase family protein [Micrococcus sp. ACRRV]|uniref:CinA family protein n=1 Tax=Micrococcus sp. ACRRV TaxID=2918203 RepID=UPI001EF26A40|nr:nicotinamide-nucleotide amidohydrolase family protein [Micrococcus sp. ACRRV]MCG7423321.1 nicotinamide-nucleotide amidohydrolase family protein [Micrococcus sp. ACRRV]
MSTGVGAAAEGEAADPARAAVRALTTAGLTVATAESLTAGLVAARLADVPGASAALQGGVVAYQNHVKAGLLGVDAGLLTARGAVDAEVARQMACGARRAAGADVGVATTGVAGPEPHQGKPVGTVFVGVAVPAELAPALAGLDGEPGAGEAAPGEAGSGGSEAGVAAAAFALTLPGNRAEIRAATVETVLDLLAALGTTGRGMPDEAPALS